MTSDIVERPDGRIIAIEVKAGATIRPADAARLAWLRDLIGDRFEIGVILHTGPRPVNISERILALPLFSSGSCEPDGASFEQSPLSAAGRIPPTVRPVRQRHPNFVRHDSEVETG